MTVVGAVGRVEGWSGIGGRTTMIGRVDQYHRRPILVQCVVEYIFSFITLVDDYVLPIVS